MIQINLLFIHLDVHLHRDQFEIFCIILPQVHHVMITSYEIDFHIQPFKNHYQYKKTTKTQNKSAPGTKQLPPPYAPARQIPE